MRRNETQLNMGRILALVLALVLVLGAMPAALAAESGNCGDGLSWELVDDTLTITGSGDMQDFPENTMAPWYPCRERIARVILPDGLTRIGDLAFYDCSALVSVRLPDSVTKIGRYAFAGCESMTMLDLGDGLEEIGEAAFRECLSLSAVRLPESLKRMDFQAFYRCESLTAVTVPESVTEMGMTTFGYCYNLVRAEILADIDVLPDWTFYGCQRLTDVSLPGSLTGANEYAFYDCVNLMSIHYEGSDENLEQIRADIDRDLAQSNNSTVSSAANPGSSSATIFEEEGENVKSQTTTATQTGNAALGSNVTVVYPNGSTEDSSSSADVDITLENPGGWSEIVEELTDIADGADQTHVDVYLKDGSTLPEGALNDLAEKNVTVTVNTSTGSSWQVDCSQMVVGEIPGTVDLSYERNPATQTQTDKLGGAAGYQISFNNSAEINAEVMVKLPTEHAMQTAYLYQMNGGEPERLQAVVVDGQGYAHFYLGSVDSGTEYLVGVNVPGEDPGDAIVPKNLHEQFDITDTLAPTDYVITGRTSTWNMDIGQVTLILVAVLVACVVVIGLTLYLLNKRKLKKGYVVDLDDYELDK